MSIIIKYIIIILIALLIGWNIRISQDDCNGICPPLEEYIERGDKDDNE